MSEDKATAAAKPFDLDAAHKQASVAIDAMDNDQVKEYLADEGIDADARLPELMASIAKYCLWEGMKVRQELGAPADAEIERRKQL